MDEKVDQLKIRLGKIEKIRELGADPYPYSFEQSHTILEVIEQSKFLKHLKAKHLQNSIEAIIQRFFLQA